ncbi:hypothetical protein XFF6992_510110 [Xanthomonas citri pv. fuscans]|nr:hypothetical protein XFF6992_510110 [Xanthomonas citri pv. fuscans]SOO35215.1 hypothetical protein XFF6994_5110032 [Xanthomonas citri pv. fuscans]
MQGSADARLLQSPVDVQEGMDVARTEVVRKGRCVRSAEMSAHARRFLLPSRHCPA